MYVGNALPVVVVRSTWLDGYDSDPPTLELELSTGAFVKVGWDVDYQHPLVWTAADRDADFVSCVARETGLGDEIETYFAEVADAARIHEADRLSDNWSDGR